LKKKYIFKSERLGFRNWTKADLTEFSKINADLEVMEHFPKPLTEKETAEFIERLENHYTKNGYNYFATEIIESGELIGFIGLAYQDYETEFTPATDIGWRLKKSSWGNGYATEVSKTLIKSGFSDFKLHKVEAGVLTENIASIRVLEKSGMTREGLRRKILPIRGQWKDNYHYAIVEDDPINY